MKNYVESGDVFYVDSTVDVVPGEIVVVGELIGVAVNGGKTGERLAVNRKGVYRLVKVNGALLKGEKIYWKPAEKRVTKTETDNVFIGYAYEAAATADPEVPVLLKG